jgi:hypothetical protein
LGPLFFFPKKWLPGHFEYSKLISKLSPEEQTEECPICFTPINQNPGEVAANESEGDHHRALLETQMLKYCYSTPCGHNFHKFCLVKWFEKKPDCPICRKSLPYVD